MNFQTSFYSALYDRFEAVQPEGLRIVRLVYPGQGISLPQLTADNNSALVTLPKVTLSGGHIFYGTSKFNDDSFGASSAARLILASACLVGTKAIFYWLNRKEIVKWIRSKGDQLRASHAVNYILDTMARRRIKKISGSSFYRKVISTSDIISFCTMSDSTSDVTTLVSRHLLGSFLSDQWRRSRLYGSIAELINSFLTELSTLPQQDSSELTALCRQKMNSDPPASSESFIVGLAEALFSILVRMPGKWNDLYLSYSNPLCKENVDVHRRVRRIVSEEDFSRAKKLLGVEAGGSEAVFQELFQLMLREEKFEKGVLDKLVRTNAKLNFDLYEFCPKDYSCFLTLHNTLSSEIRLMIQRASVITNVADESQFQDSGRIDLQIAIQAIASGKQRDDMFVKDEDILKSEAWTILIDSSKSLQESSDTLKAAAICLAETAKGVMGSRRWGMFAFSDKLEVIKYYDETYGRDAKARIGGLRQEGLSHIPDALRAVHCMATDYLKEKNYIILVSDGIPSGYIGIEEEFSKSVRESSRIGAQVGAISLSGNRVHGAVHKSKEIQQQSDIVKAFIQIYNEMSF